LLSTSETEQKIIKLWLINTQPSSEKIFKLAASFSRLGETMPYCTKCGSPLKEEDKFCPVCGAPAAKVTREEFSVLSSNLVDRVSELLHEGNVTKIIVKDEKDKQLLEIPATVGVLGVVVAPWLAALGVIAALVTNCKIVVERRE
jgi:uncharacterized Zn finger protein (UPF0148 family)